MKTESLGIFLSSSMTNISGCLKKTVSLLLPSPGLASEHILDIPFLWSRFLIFSPSYLMSLFTSCQFQYDYIEFMRSSFASITSKEVDLFTVCQSYNVRLYVLSASRLSPHFTSLSTHSDSCTSLIAGCVSTPASRHG